MDYVKRLSIPTQYTIGDGLRNPEVQSGEGPATTRGSGPSEGVCESAVCGSGPVGLGLWITYLG